MNARATLSLLKPSYIEAKVTRLDNESDWHYQARCTAIKALGLNWQRHPKYTGPARHSTHTDVWTAARQPFLDAIAATAAADRARNPAAVKAAGVRSAMGGA